jgi:aminoglycoside phosphotransferase (APT) family kinase protein
LLGTSSTTLHAIDLVDRDGGRHRLALRRFHNLRRLAADPWYRPANEAAVLELLAGTGVPAPRLLAADLEAAVCDVPALLITRLPGTVGSAPAKADRLLGGLADLLVQVHAVEVGPSAATHRPQFYGTYYDPAVDGPRRVPPWSRDPRMWERVLEVLEDPAPEEATAGTRAVGFIHRDYHPGQVLWVDGKVSGLVDWTTGCLGPRGIDLARMRLNLAGSHGADLAERFLAAYRRASGADPHHPYWDLLDAGDLILDLLAAERAAYDRFEAWVRRALGSL